MTGQLGGSPLFPLVLNLIDRCQMVTEDFLLNGPVCRSHNDFFSSKLKIVTDFGK